MDLNHSRNRLVCSSQMNNNEPLVNLFFSLLLSLCLDQSNYPRYPQDPRFSLLHLPHILAALLALDGSPHPQVRQF